MTTSRRRLYAWAFLVLAGVALYAFWPTEEQRIERTLHGLARALEEKNADDVMSFLSFNYSDNHGARYLLVKKQLERWLPEYSDIQVEVEPASILVSQNTAQVRTGLRVSAVHGYDMGYFVGDFDHPAPVALVMEKHPPGKWLVLKVVYELR